VWHERLWLIDHGAALYLQHRGLDPEADAARPFPAVAQHVLLPAAAPIPDAHSRLADGFDRERIAAVVELVPPEWLAGDPELYVEYLHRRLVAASFVSEAEDARQRA
jgi:hypothetical protein